MANMTVIKKKQGKVQELKARLSESELVIVSGYSGLTVAQLTSLRRKFSPENANLTVYKNTVSSFALKELDVDHNEDLLTGPVALITGAGDIAKISKIAVDYSKENENFSLKGGIFNSQVIDFDAINHLASLPSKEQLIAQVVGGIKAPLTNFVMVLSGTTRSLVYVLDAIKNQKQAAEQ